MRDFYLLYQPKLKNGKIVGLEALLRPRNKSLNLIDYLKKVKEKEKLDLEVMNQCISDIDEFNINIPVSINIHPESINIIFFVKKTIRKLNNKNITLELVEHQEIKLTDEFLTNINIIKNSGIKISMDDFGKDFARTDIALNLSVDEVKFDRSLINGIEHKYSKFKHLSFLYTKIKTLCNSDIIFEGVENKRQKDLIELFSKNPTIQGFYYYPPIKLKDVINLTEFDNKFKEKKPIKNTTSNLDYSLYQYIVKNDIKCLKSKAVNDFIKENDHLGLVYSEDINESLSNFKNIYFNSSSIIDKGALSLISSAEKIVVIRNEKGVVVYDNNAHQKMIGSSLVGIDPNEVIKNDKNYIDFLIRDKILFCNKKQKISKCIEDFMGNKYETIREKIIYNHKAYIITTFDLFEIFNNKNLSP